MQCRNLIARMLCTKSELQEGGVLRAESTSSMRHPMLIKFEQCIVSDNKASNVRTLE